MRGVLPVGSSLHLMDACPHIHNGRLITWVRLMNYMCRAHTKCAILINISAPEYALDEVLDPTSDMYSLGCLMYAVHCKGNPPFKNHGSLSSLRVNAGKPLTGMERLDPDLRGRDSYLFRATYPFWLNSSLTTSAIKRTYHSANPFTTLTRHSTPTSILLFSSCINIELPRSHQLLYQISGGKDIFYEGPHKCSR